MSGTEVDPIEAVRNRIEALLKITRPLILEEIIEQVEQPREQVIAALQWLVMHDRIKTTGDNPQYWTL